jgi:hypothetical protein
LYRLIDLLNPLHTSGVIDDNAYQEASKWSAGATGVDKEHPALTVGSSVLVAESTLKTIAKGGILDALADAFQVHLSPEDAAGVRSEVAFFRSLEEVKDWHGEMWDIVRSNPQFVVTPYRVPVQGVGNARTVREEPMLAATTLAKQLELPLLADDRVCQTIVLNEKGTDASAAFGSDCMVLALLRDGTLKVDEAVAALLNLIEWRYRFIVLPGEILKAMSDRYVNHPPGRELRCVAEYVHECMRDPGLLCGFEKTEPPTTVGSRLFQEWAGAVSEMIVTIWEDSTYGEEKAKAITEWVVKELVPSPPKNLGPKGSAIGAMSHEVVLRRAMIQCVSMREPAKANSMLVTIAKALGMNEEQLVREAAEVIDGI